VTENQGGRPRPPATERAEELVDRLGESVGNFASLAGWRMLKVAAFVREGAEDVWAEAQSVRRTRGARREERYAEPAGAAESLRATDVARRAAEDLDVDLREVRGTGVGGLITLSDVKRKSKEGA
jgi:pyruvate/2-oxoglutarate dehydrogenase complex dihydrolipoamide acyltransferase (E2) component